MKSQQGQVEEGSDDDEDEEGSESDDHVATMT
jgi:hypothetical protein